MKQAKPDLKGVREGQGVPGARGARGGKGEESYNNVSMLINISKKVQTHLCPRLSGLVEIKMNLSIKSVDNTITGKVSRETMSSG